jgi:hypothetical protein
MPTFMMHQRLGGIAVLRVLGKDEVAGSIPARGLKKVISESFSKNNFKMKLFYLHH